MPMKFFLVLLKYLNYTNKVWLANGRRHTTTTCSRLSIVRIVAYLQNFKNLIGIDKNFL